MVIFVLLFLSFGFPGLSLAPLVFINKKDLLRVNDLASLQEGQVFYELGSGSGGLAWYVAKKNPHVKVVGIEISPLLHWYAKIKNTLNRQANLSFVRGNVLKKDLSEADVLYTFALTETVNKKLKPKLKKEMGNEAKFISYMFRMHDWEGKEVIDKPSEKQVAIFVYTK